MRHLISTAVVLAAASPAIAQPVTRPEMRAEMCGVTFVRAPDEVRYVIEQWLRAEPRCSSSIELRVVPTDGGLYLLAQRPDGRIHERLVPDAQSAGVLVASWVADAWTAPPAPAPSEPLTVIVDPLRVGAPGAVSVAAVATPRSHRPGKWMSLGMVLQPDNEGGGFRGEADLMNLGSLKLGGAITYSESNYDLMQDAGWTYGFLTMKDLKVMAYLTRAWSWGRWEVRGGLGLGAIHTYGYVVGDTGGAAGSGIQDYDVEQTFPVGELSGLVTRRLGDSWGVALGPVVTILDQKFDAGSVDGNVQRTMPQLMVFGGLRYEL